jgi:methanogenic corrinoid protein MtbC1
MKPVMKEWIFCFSVVFGFFIMFALFFIEEYIHKKNKKEKKDKRTADTLKNDENHDVGKKKQ